MATVEQLKEIIIKLRVDLAKTTVPYGHCPYCYYPGITHKECCDDCDKCKREFFEKYESLTRQEVEKW